MRHLKNAINMRWLMVTLWLSVIARTVLAWVYDHIWFPLRFYYHLFLRWVGNLLGRVGLALKDKSRRWMMSISPPSATLEYLRERVTEEKYSDEVFEERW